MNQYIFALEQEDMSNYKSEFKTWLKRHLVKIKRMQYTLILIACLTVLAIQAAECIKKYMAKSTGIHKPEGGELHRNFKKF